MSTKLSPQESRQIRNKLKREILQEIYDLLNGKDIIASAPLPTRNGEELYFMELRNDGYFNFSTYNREKHPIVSLTQKGRDEVENKFPTFSDSSSIQIDEEIFIRSFTNLEDYHIRTLEDLRKFEKTFKGMEQGIRDLKEQLTDISLKMDESELRKEIDSLRDALDPMHITGSFVHLYRLWQNPKYEPFRNFLAKKIPLLEDTMESMPVKGLL